MTNDTASVKAILRVAPSGSARNFAVLQEVLGTDEASIIIGTREEEVYVACLSAGLMMAQAEKIVNDVGQGFVPDVIEMIAAGAPYEHIQKLLTGWTQEDKSTAFERLLCYKRFLVSEVLSPYTCMRFTEAVSQNATAEQLINNLSRTGLTTQEVKKLLDIEDQRRKDDPNYTLNPSTLELAWGSLKLHRRQMSLDSFREALAGPNLYGALLLRKSGATPEDIKQLLASHSGRADVDSYFSLSRRGYLHEHIYAAIVRGGSDVEEYAALLSMNLTGEQAEQVLAWDKSRAIVYRIVKEGCEVSHDEAVYLAHTICSQQSSTVEEADFFLKARAFVDVWSTGKVNPLDMRSVANDGLDCKELKKFVDSGIAFTVARNAMRRGVNAEFFVRLHDKSVPLKLIYQAHRYDVSLDDMLFALENGLTAEEFLDIAV